MPPTIIRSEEYDRNRRLRELGLVKPDYNDPRGALHEAVRACVAGRAGSTDNNARSSHGYNAWDYTIRRIREVFRGWGNWDKWEENGVEGIINHKLKVKVAVVSTDNGTCDANKSPRNRTPKGAATEKVTDLNSQYSLFGVGEPTENGDGYQLWELCIFDDGNNVLAELSLPVVFEDGHFIKFAERIFLIDPGEWDQIRVAGDDEAGEDIEPLVRRK